MGLFGDKLGGLFNRFLKQAYLFQSIFLYNNDNFISEEYRINKINLVA